MVDKLIPLTPKMMEELRRDQFRRQRGKCAILNRSIAFEDAVMDHKHKLKAQECGGPEGLGCCRGMLHRDVNSFEGKLERLWKRYGLQELIDLPTLLRRCADYMENPPMAPVYIHPHEKPKRARLLKPDYKRICKYYFDMYPKRKKLPKYPKDGILTQKWVDMLALANAHHAASQRKVKRIRSKF